MKIGEINGLSLAFFGDAVIELLVRKRLVQSGQSDLGEMNARADAATNAVSQNNISKKIFPHLTEDEKNVFNRGKNSKFGKIPKSATLSEYKKATALETLFGALYLENKIARMEELFDLGFSEYLSEK